LSFFRNGHLQMYLLIYLSYVIQVVEATSRVFASSSSWNEVFARKEEQKEIGQLEHNKPRRLHQLHISHL